MVTRGALKVRKMHSPIAILRTFEPSLVLINHEIHSHSYDFLYLPIFDINNGANKNGKAEQCCEDHCGSFPCP